MPNFWDICDEPADEAPRLELVRLGPEPSMLLFFTTEAEPALLHFLKDDAVFSYVPCPGNECPVCYVASRARESVLMPVVNIESKRVEVLRVARSFGTDGLLMALRPHLRDDHAFADKLFLIRREGARFYVDVRPLGEHADRCEAAVGAFLRDNSEGLSLLSAFPSFTATELAEVESVRAKLDAVGGWQPPNPERSATPFDKE